MAPVQPLRLVGLLAVLAIPPLVIDFVVEEWVLADAKLGMAELLLLRTCIMCAWVSIGVFSYRLLSKRRLRKDQADLREPS
jgi:hypothetical protein